MSRKAALIPRIGAIVACLLVWPGSPALGASDSPPAKSRPQWKTGGLFVKDAGSVFSAPGRWKKKQWDAFGIAAAAVVGSALLDTTIRDAAQRHRGGTAESIANAVEPFGAAYSFVVIAGFYIGGVSAHDRKARETAVDAVAGTLIASGIITPILKKVAGRARPADSDGDPHRYQPFSGGAAFPSGHATQAFVVASVIAAHYDRKWVQGLSYGIASAVGLARILHDRHWASDVVAGSLIGAAVGTEIVRCNESLRSAGKARVSIVPLIKRDGYGGALLATF